MAPTPLPLLSAGAGGDVQEKKSQGWFALMIHQVAPKSGRELGS